MGQLLKILRFLLLIVVLPSLAVPRSGASIALQSTERWRSVRTNNLFVIGNTAPDELRQVASWLEFFHSAFTRLLSRSTIDTSVPTTVIVFRDDASFVPFKPLYQGLPANVAGYFQPGEDVNYIALSLDHSERNPYSTAFHEYVHLHLRDNVPGMPLWLNEGLAEFYGSTQFSGSDALVGVMIPSYVQLLRSHELLPLKTLFSVDTNSSDYNEQNKSGLFYGESWALVHYLMLGDNGRHQEQLKRFLQLVARGDGSEKTFEDSFGMTLDTAEKELSQYVRSGSFAAQRVAVGDNAQGFTSYTAMQRTSLSDSEADYYLGDLLVHTRREDEAERYFLRSISSDPNFLPPYASMGMMRVRQRRYDESKKYLQKAATASDNYLIHYLYAYVLSREGAGPSGEVSEYSRDKVLIMRDQLQHSIKQAPNFASSYHLLALVDLVADDKIDEAVTMAEKAHQLEPAKSNHTILLAHAYVRQSKTNAALELLEKLKQDSNSSVRAEASSLFESLANRKESGSTSGSRLAQKPVTMSSDPGEPVQVSNSTSRMLGNTSAGAVRNGQTIDSSGSLPTVDEVLAHYIEALGGATALKAITSRITKGSLDVVGVSRNGSFEINELAPNKNLTRMESYTLGAISLGFNGRTAWMKNRSGLRELKGSDLAAMQLNSDIYEPLRLKNKFAKVTLLGKSKIGYRDVYVLELQPSTGPSQKLHLDAETFLPVRINATRINGSQMVGVEMYLDDWRTVDGIKLPFSITQTFAGLTLLFRINEVRHNVQLDSSIFDMPSR